MPGVSWTDANDRKLLLAIIQVVQQNPISGAQWTEIADKLGTDFTVSAISQRYKKKLLKEDVVPNGNANSAPATPKAKGKGAGKRKKEETAEQEDDEDESPFKKEKLKGEDEDGDDEASG